MQIDHRDVGGVSVLDVVGDLAVGDHEDVFRRHMQTLAARGQRDIVLNLARVTRVDSVCIGLMVATHVSLGNRGGRLRLANLQRRVRQQLEIAKLDEVLHIYGSEAEALAP